MPTTDWRQPPDLVCAAAGIAGKHTRRITTSLFILIIITSPALFWNKLKVGDTDFIVALNQESELSLGEVPAGLGK